MVLAKQLEQTVGEQRDTWDREMFEIKEYFK